VTELLSLAEVEEGAEALGAGVFEDLSTASKAVPFDREYARRRRFDGRRGCVLELPGEDSTLAVLVGAGKRESTRAAERAETLRRAGAAFARATVGIGNASFDLAGLYEDGGVKDGLGAGAAAQAFAEGFLLAAHRFKGYKSYKGEEEPPPAPPARLSLASHDEEEVNAGLERASVIAAAVTFARDIGDEPAAEMTPRRVAAIAAEVAAKSGLELAVLDEAGIAREGLGGLAGVARGSSEPARLIILRYRPEHSRATPKKVVLVGKGITFDSGGLTLKSYDGMKRMKTDMCGAAAVIATLSACRALDVPVVVTGIVPATENMPGPGALKPGDVLTIRNGKTIEVLNTDAEGRLVLADALSLATEEEPDVIVDLATLTGACVVALGAQIAGTMGNDGELLSLVREASERAGEPTWELPLPEEYRRQIDSEVADMKNVGTPGQGGAVVAGLILAEFVGGVPWVHLDIAGPGRSDEDRGYFRKGTTGFGVRTLLEMLGGLDESAWVPA
jgi:leucyl aminopeptidase